MNITMSSGVSVTINGTTYKGNNICFDGDKVTIDGKEKDNSLQGVGKITVTVNGDVDTLTTTSGDIIVKGSVGCNVKTTSGDVEIVGDVYGSVATISGDVEVNTIKGSCSTISGDIN
jgi:DUF4097 and DUF4098 domain-containing protein YvlB